MLVPARAIFLVCAPSKIDEQSGAQIVFDFKTKATHERCLSPLFNLRLCAGGLKERAKDTRGVHPGVSCTANQRCSVNRATDFGFKFISGNRGGNIYSKNKY